MRTLVATRLVLGRAGVLLALAVGLSGCVHAFRVKVDARHNPAAPTGRSYHLISPNDVTAGNEVDDAALLSQLRTELAGHGMFEAADAESAEMIIEIDYGIAATRERVETVTVAPIPPEMAQANERTLPQDRALGPRDARDFSTSTLPVAPEFTELRRTLVYEKYLSLVARLAGTASHSPRPIELWRITATIEDASGNIHDYLPMLVNAATAQIGDTSSRTRVITVAKSDW